MYNKDVIALNSTIKVKGDMKMKAVSALGVFAVLVSLVILTGCGGNRDDFVSDPDWVAVPNVMGMNYNDAIRTLENFGFEVTAVGADASTILSGNVWDRSVLQGQVFRVNNETNPNYWDSEWSPIAPNNMVVITYAIADYIFEVIARQDDTNDFEAVEDSFDNAETEDEAMAHDYSEDESTTQAENIDTDTGGEDVHITQSTDTPTVNGIEAWRQFLIDYEAWMEAYIEFMARFSANPSDMTLLLEYIALIEQLGEWSVRSEEIELELANNPAALAEYMATLTRILLRMATMQ